MKSGKYNDFGDTFGPADCRRVPMSGADKYFDQGDLIVSERLRKLFPFCVECKHRKNFRLEHVFMQVKDFVDYHRQVLDACQREKHCRIPMLVIRGNQGAIFASVPLGPFRTVAVQGMPEEAAVVMYRLLSQRWLLSDLNTMLQAIFNS